MGIENFKRWHWIIIGVVVGLVIAYVRLGLEPDYPRSVGLQEFEREVSAFDLPGDAPRLRQIVLHPPVEGVYKKDVQIVTFLRAQYNNDRKGWVYQPSAMKVELPFSRNGQVEYGGSFQSYMDEVAKGEPKVRFRYAWWEAPNAQFGLWTAGCVVIIGGVWPTIVNVLIGAGLGRPPKKEADYDLERFGKYKEEQAAAAAPKTMSAAEQEQLARVTSTLEKELAPSGNRMNLGVDPTLHPEQPVKKLDAKALEIAAIEKEEEDKEYKGEYYPVARQGGHHDKKDGG
jgi:hypothetical protein